MTFVENPRLRRRVLSAIGRAWERGQPLSKRPTDGDRFIARVIARGRIGVAIAVENELFAALRAKEIHEEVIVRNPPTFGLRLASQPAKTGEDRAKTSPMRRRPSSPGNARSLKPLGNFQGEDVGEDRAKTLGRPRKPLKKRAKTAGEDALGDTFSITKKRGGARRAAPPLFFRAGEPAKFGSRFVRGDVIVDRGQRFVCVDVVPCVRKTDGRPSAYSVWRGECADCGAPFVTNAFSNKWRLVSRRCERHRQPRKLTQFAKRSAP